MRQLVAALFETHQCEMMMVMQGVSLFATPLGPMCWYAGIRIGKLNDKEIKVMNIKRITLYILMEMMQLGSLMAGLRVIVLGKLRDFLTAVSLEFVLL